MQTALNVGIIGYGVSAKTFHIPFLINNPLFNWKAVVERTTRNAENDFPGIITYRSAAELFNDPGIDLVIITTPNQTHLPFSKAAMQNGKHVVVEKPFTITTADAKELIAVSNETGKLLSIYHNRRYTTDFSTIQQILQQDLLGQLAEAEIQYNRYRVEAKPNAWREEPLPGSGILYDLGSHLIDQALLLFGIPQYITATVKMQRPHAKADDYFDLHLDYGFLQVRLKAGMLVREPGPRYQLHGTLGSFLKYGTDPQEEQLKAGMAVSNPQFGVEPETIWGVLHTLVNGEVTKKKYPSLRATHTDYYKNIYDAIVNKAPLAVTPQMAHNTIRLIELANESAAKKCSIACNGFV